MAKGQNSKKLAMDTILKTFLGSFIYDKEIRIPYEEDGEQIQLKCTLTCAKVNVEPNGDVAIPGENNNNNNNEVNFSESLSKEKTIEPTQEEKDNVKRLMDIFGL